MKINQNHPLGWEKSQLYYGLGHAHKRMKKFLIYGSKVFAGVLKDLAMTCDYAYAGLIDN